MKIRTVSDRNAGEILVEAEEIIRAGGIVIAPTDTVYGIIGDARRVSVVKNVFAIKKRSAEKAFPVFLGSVKDARRWAYIPDHKAKFFARVSPVQVTVIFKKKGILPPALTSGADTIGIRIPDHPFLQKLLSFFDFPLLQTSANISLEPPARTPEDVLRYFRGNRLVDLFIRAGTLPGTPSTVVDFTGDHPIVVRTGLVTKAELDRLLRL